MRLQDVQGHFKKAVNGAELCKIPWFSACAHIPEKNIGIPCTQLLYSLGTLFSS